MYPGDSIPLAPVTSAWEQRSKYSIKKMFVKFAQNYTAETRKFEV